MLVEAGADLDQVNESAQRVVIETLVKAVIEDSGIKSEKLIRTFAQILSGKRHESITPSTAIARQEERATGAAKGRATDAPVSNRGSEVRETLMKRQTRIPAQSVAAGSAPEGKMASRPRSSSL